MKRSLSYNLLLVFFLFGNIAIAQDAGLNLANTEITKLAEEKNYLPTDVATSTLSDDYVSGGIRHIYYQQTIDQIGIYGTSASVHLKDGVIISSNLNFLPQLEKRNIQKQFQVQALEAVARLAIGKGYPLSQTELLILEADDASPDQTTTVSPAGISNRTIPLKLVYFVNDQEEVQLAWNLFIDEVDGGSYKNYIIDAATGEILLEKDLTIRCSFDHDHTHDHDHSNKGDISHLHDHQKNTKAATLTTQVANTDSTYHVLKYNIESPNFGTRSIEVKPWDNQVASPNGWHSMFGVDYEYTIGNNVDAYADRDNTNDPTGENNARAFGGSNLLFDQAWDVNGNTPLDYTKAATVNLFYMNNIAHDVFYNYGFDEVSGNFQEDNFNKGGNGSDNVLAEAQDASGTCNANMSTPGDGANPRMQMYLCGNKDGSFDNAIILHEFGHGVSNRLTGGPNAVACLGNIEQMGEGWSDFFGLIFTMKSTDLETTNRTIGTFLFNQDANGAGLRPYPYTTDMSVNPMTYKTIDDEGITRPHGVGAVWATMLWDLNWALINQYGWNPDLNDGASTITGQTGGNNIALRLVMEGLKIQPCSPGFVDGRDAILAADLALYGGIHRCLIWEVFARRGLGYNADQGSTNSREDGMESYDMPPECTIELEHTADRTTAYLGERISFELKAINHLDAIVPNVVITDTIPENVQFYSASDGAVVNGNVVTWPAFNLPANGSKTLELTFQVDDAIEFDEDFLDDLESGGSNWRQVQVSGNHAWVLQNTYHYSPSNAWQITNAATTTETHLVLKDPLHLTSTSELTFNHFFNLEDRYDFGLVEISVDGGTTWVDLESNFTQNGYNNYTQFGHYAYSGSSTAITPNNNGYISSKADLSPYANKVAIIRFRLLTDVNTAAFGWIVDDIGISNTNYALPNLSNIRSSEYNFDTQVDMPVVINQTLVNHTVETNSDTLVTIENSAISYADVQANDIDADGPSDILTTTILSAATSGTATVINNDSIGYVPNSGFVGRDTVIYQVCDVLNACESDTLFVIVEELNVAPVAMDDLAIVSENSTDNIIDVQVNDTDANAPNDMMTTSIVTSALRGTESVAANGTIIYTPTANYYGQDTIVYQVCDQGNLCAQSSIFITVSFLNTAPLTNKDFLVIDKNTSNNFINVLGNDSDPDGAWDTLVTNILQAPSNGTATVINKDSINYVPTTNFIGSDIIVYQACDISNACVRDSVFITVNDFNESPSAVVDNATVEEGSTNNIIDVQANDSDPNGAGDNLVTSIVKMPTHGTASVVNANSISYTPTAAYMGLDTIVYQVCDTGNLCDADTLFLNVVPVNHPPVAVADYVEMNRDETNKIIQVQLNDSDPDGAGDMLVTSIIESASSGTETVLSDNTLSYTPNVGFVGMDHIVYQICDTSNLCAFNTVFITVKDFNEGPTANPDNVPLLENSTNNIIDVQLNDTDPNGVGDFLVTTIIENPSHGVATILNEDSISYTPTAEYFGLDQIIYQVCDTANVCSMSTVFIEVLEVNLAPITKPDYMTVGRNSKDISIDVQENDYDPNGAGEILVTSILDGAFHGIVGVMDNDSLVYSPATDYFGQDTVVYEVCDAGGLCAAGTLYITVSESFACVSDDLTKDENDMVAGDYVAANSITSSGTISSTAKVKFIAGTSITLSAGFHAEVGSSFAALIDNCDNTINLTEEPTTQKELFNSAPLLERQPITKENSLLIRPNPFRQNAIIDYEIGTDSRVWIGMHDLTGRVIHVFVDHQALNQGKYQYSISSANLANGTYWVTMRTADSVLTKKIIVLQN